MITTGTPVTVALFEWLTWYASNHKDWFDKTSSSYNEINKFLCGTSEDVTENIKSFFTFIAVLLLIFDGGLFTDNLKFVSEKNKGLSLRFVNDICHELSYSGWDRTTRMAIDYIIIRLINYENFTADIVPALPIMHSNLMLHRQKLQYNIGAIPSLNQLINNSVQLTKEMFIVISSLPIALLDSFYVDLAQALPNEFFLEAIGQQMSVKEFFSRPQTDSILVLDKVKMHYNLHFHSNSDLPFLPILNDRTLLFFKQTLSDSTVFAAVQSELDRVLNDQFQPRLTLLSLVLDHFNWPT